MNKNSLKKLLLIVLSGLVLLTKVQAGIPVWTAVSDRNYPAAISISANETATIQYTVTNQSKRTHKVQIRPIQGITNSGCTETLAHNQSCTLTLTVNGNALNGDIIGGPIFCDHANPLECYLPSPGSSLAIHLVQQPPVQNYTVTPSAGPNGSINPDTVQVVSLGTSLVFTATPNSGYTVIGWLVDGVNAQTGGTTFALNTITANHTVRVEFILISLMPSQTNLVMAAKCQPSSSSCFTKHNETLTGNAREIKIYNKGLTKATNVSISASGLPLNTNIISNTCSGATINPNEYCTLILEPGEVVSSDAHGIPCISGSQPLPGTINITADGGLASEVSVYVLGYGCYYQGGYLYSIDDSTDSTKSVDIKVAPNKEQVDSLSHKSITAIEVA